MKDLARYDLSQKNTNAVVASPKMPPKFDARLLLLQMCGVDLTRIDRIDVTNRV